MTDNAHMTTPAQFGAFGGAARRLLAAGMQPDKLRTNETLAKEEWIQFDEAIIEEAMIRLQGVGDLISAGLTFNLQNALGTTIVQWETVEDMQDAIQSMDGATRGLLDRMEFNLNNLPVYITHKDFRLSIRHLEASRRLGESIDTTQARNATRRVAERIEKSLFQGSGVTVDGNTVRGYTNHPNRNTRAFGAGVWSLTATTGANIITDVLNMITDLEADRFFGPYWLYVPAGFSVKLEDDHKANSDRTIRERLLAISGLNAVRVADQLTANQVVLVNASREVIDLVQGFDPRMIEWETDGGMVLNFKVMAIQVPRLKADAQGRMGVAHMS